MLALVPRFRCFVPLQLDILAVATILSGFVNAVTLFSGTFRDLSPPGTFPFKSYLFSFPLSFFFLIRILFSFVIFDVFIHYLIMDSEFCNGVFSFLSILVSRRLFACLFSKLLYLCC